MGYSMKMGSRQNNDPNNFSQRDQGTINQAPSSFTSFIRNFKNSPKYSFARNILSVGGALLPIPFLGKGKAVKNVVNRFVPPPPSSSTINNIVNKNIKNVTNDVIKVQGGYVPKGYKNYPIKGLQLPAKNMKKYEVDGKLYGHFYEDGKLTNKFIQKNQ